MKERLDSIRAWIGFKLMFWSMNWLGIKVVSLYAPDAENEDDDADVKAFFFAYTEEDLTEACKDYVSED